MLSRDFCFYVFGGALAAAPFLCLANGYLCTLPVPFYFAFAALGWLGVPVLLLLPAAFWWFARQLRRGAEIVPRRSVVLFGLGTALSLVWTIAGYTDAHEWQGAGYARLVAALNLGIPLMLAALLRQNLRRNCWPLAFAFHWLLFAWLGSYAFAYMGETP